MTESHPHVALSVHGQKLSFVWIIPFVVVLAALWLGWRSYANRGIDVTLSFSSAAGIEAGRTKIKYKEADLGSVTRVGLSDDMSHIIVEARIEKVAAPYLTEDAHFWLVRPSIALSHFSGLGTIISGPYIQFVPGKSASSPSRHFAGGELPAILPPDEPGAVYKLHTQHIRGIDQGTPIYFHGASAGKVLGYEISDREGDVTVYAFVRAPYNRFVRKNTHFWNVSGISLHGGSDGLDVNIESLQAIIAGGIAFGAFDGDTPDIKAQENADFTLYTNLADAQDAVYTLRIPFLLYLPQPANGLGLGAAVRLQGMDIGHVTAINTVYDEAQNRMLLPVEIEIEPERLALLHQEGHKVESAAQGYAIFRKLVASGLRARLGTTNLLTGQKFIDLAVIAGVPRMRLLEGGKYPEIPAMRAQDIDALMDSAQALLATLRTTAAHVNQALEDDDNGTDLAGTLQELKDAARSVRTLADYLDNHPEALLRGKPAEGE